MKNKTCVKCNKEQPIKMFYKSKQTKDCIDYYCKECRKASALRSHRFGTDKEVCTVDECTRLNYSKSLCRIHYERKRRTGSTDLINYRKEMYESSGATYWATRKNHLNLRFKLTLEQYEEMAKNGCEICGAHALPHKQLHVDHDHKCCPPVYKDSTKRDAYWYKTCGLCVRGIVCDKCNQAIGRYERGLLRPEYPLRNEIMMYVAKHDWLISDRIKNHDKEQGNR